MSFPPYLPYPADRYGAPDGEVSATLRRADDPPDLAYPNGVEVDYLATGASTGGDFGLYRWTFGPDETGPGPHFHRAVSESFFVLSGRVRIYNGEEWVTAGSGDFVHVPPGGVHGFRNVTDEPASMLLHFSPGAPREGYFEGLLALRDDSFEPTEEQLAEFYLRHDNHWL
jgi:mannose-6-phosphate isomerase-like protein (cupin superfamily)